MRVQTVSEPEPTPSVDVALKTVYPPKPVHPLKPHPLNPLKPVHPPTVDVFVVDVNDKHDSGFLINWIACNAHHLNPDGSVKMFAAEK